MRNFNSKNKKFFANRRSRSGYTLIELLFYIALFALLSIAVINSMITMTKAFKETGIQGELGQSSDIMERMSREIRKAKDISSLSATDLVLSTTDDSGAAKTVEFRVVVHDIELLEDGVLTGNLNTPNLAITALNFTQIATAQGKAVKVALTLKSKNDTQGRTIDFNDTIALRGQY